MINTSENINVFIAYVEEDRPFLQELVEHLSVLERLGMVDKIWYNEMITAGSEWEAETLKALQNADIILLLISSKFISSDFSYNQEMEQALARHKEGTARTIPIIIRPCLWDRTPFSNLQVLPKNKIPVSSNEWKQVDEPYVEIVEEVEQIIIELKQKEIGGNQQKEHSEFNRNVEEADHYFAARKWQEAKARYQEALLYAVDQSPEKRASIEERINLCENEYYFQRNLARGEKAYQEERYEEAKVAFAKALIFKPEDEEAQRFQAALNTKTSGEIPEEAPAKAADQDQSKAENTKTFQIKLFGIEIFKLVISLCLIGVVATVGLRLLSQEESYIARVEPGGVVYTDEAGEVVLKTDYLDGKDFALGVAPVENERHKWGYINSNNEAQLSFSYDKAWPHSEVGLAYVQQDGKCGFIDLKGEVKIPLIYLDAASFSEGLAMVKKGEKDFAFIDSDGNEKITGLEGVLTPKFENGEAVVIKGGQTMTIDISGKCLEACPPSADKNAWSEEQKKTAIEKYEKQIEALKEKGKYQRALMKAKEIKNLSSSPAVKMDIDNQIDLLQRKINEGKEAAYKKLLKEAEPLFRKGDFIKAKALYQEALKIDILFKEVAESNLILCETYIAREAAETSEVYGFQHPNGKWGIKTADREVLVAPRYDSTGVFANGFIAVEEEGLWGFVNEEGKLQIKPFYESVAPFSATGLAKTIKNGEEGFIDRKGRQAEPREED